MPKTVIVLSFQGKFIRIHFNTQGKLAGCDIETYLLEKSRITFQQDVERSYHIFYQLMQQAVPDLKEKCRLSNDIYDYHYVSQGKTSVPSIDDNEDLEFTHDAFNILHFTEEETFNIYKIVSAVMNMGELVRSIKDFLPVAKLSDYNIQLYSRTLSMFLAVTTQES